MKKNILYITLIFALCFGIKAQAQNIIDYQAKLNSLSNTQAEQLNHLIRGASTTIYVTTQNEAELFKGNTVQVSVMKVTQSRDFAKLTGRFSNQLNEVTALSIDWDGQEELVIPTGLIDLLPNLKYIYIQSYEVLNQTVIQNRFSNLLNQLDRNTTVEVLFYTMEQPS